MTAGPARPVARLLVFDAADRLLLLHGHDPSEPELGDWWFTPGGGLHPGEGPETAARRELGEETGLQVGALTRLGTRVARFRFDGRDHHQEETWWSGRVLPAEPAPVALTVGERRFLLGSRWWSHAELTAGGEVVHPADLARIVAAVLAGSRPW